MRHAPGDRLPRHCHREAFAAIVLTGGYDEAGDTGRHRVSAGDVVFHRAFESHLDRFSRPGAEVLVLPLPSAWSGDRLGSIVDPDALVRAGENDPNEALEMLLSEVAHRRVEGGDWPEMLAAALRDDPSIPLHTWAERANLHPGSLARGFAQVFGTTPAAYRQSQRARRAIDGLIHSDLPLSRLAFDCGFADQAHMTRAVAVLAGEPPTALRRRYRHGTTQSPSDR